MTGTEPDLLGDSVSQLKETEFSFGQVELKGYWVTQEGREFGEPGLRMDPGAEVWGPIRPTTAPGQGAEVFFRSPVSWLRSHHLLGLDWVMGWLNSDEVSIRCSNEEETMPHRKSEDPWEWKQMLHIQKTLVKETEAAVI